MNKDLYNPFPKYTKILGIEPKYCVLLRKYIERFLEIGVEHLQGITYGEVAMIYWLLINHYNFDPLPIKEK